MTEMLGSAQQEHDRGFVLEFLVRVAGDDATEEIKALAEEKLRQLVVQKPGLSIVDVVEAFERVPMLEKFAARLRKAALPGECCKYFSQPEMGMLVLADLKNLVTRAHSAPPEGVRLNPLTIIHDEF